MVASAVDETVRKCQGKVVFSWFICKQINVKILTQLKNLSIGWPVYIKPVVISSR